MRGALRRPGRIVPLLVAGVLHAGCASSLPVRFLEPEGARVEVRRPGILSSDRGGTIPFDAKLPGGAYEVTVTAPARDGEAPPPLHGVLVVRDVARWESAPLPAEFRLMAWDLERVGESTEVRWSCAGTGWMDLRFKGSMRGFPLDDPEVKEWLAEAAPPPPPMEAAPDFPRPEPLDAAADDDDSDTLTWGKVAVGVVLIVAYAAYAVLWSVAVICGARP